MSDIIYLPVIPDDVQQCEVMQKIGLTMATDEKVKPTALRVLFKFAGKGSIKDICALSVIPSVPDDVEVFSDLPYQNVQGVSLAMDVYRPKKYSSGTLPIIILVHGGRLVAGNRCMSRGISTQFAEKGSLVFVPDYRLCSETDGLGEISDVCAGLKKVLQRESLNTVGIHQRSVSLPKAQGLI